MTMRKDQFVNDFLSSDHQRLDVLFESLVASVKDKKPFDHQIMLFQLFKSGLLRHIYWEDTIIYPIYTGYVGKTIEPIESMMVEHQQLEAMITEVEQQCRESFDLDYLMALGQFLSSHNEKEEKLLDPVMDDFSHHEIKEKIAIEISRSFK